MKEKILIDIASNAMTASISFEAPSEGGDLITESDIYAKLTETGIVYGIDEPKISHLMIHREYGKRYPIAHGNQSGQGENGHIEYLFDTEGASLKPKELPDGTVDYKNLDNITMVKKGEKLAQIVAPTEGEKGITVKGQEIAGKPGKPVTPPKGKGIVIADGFILADVTGKVTFVDRKINVLDLYEVAGDVGPATGNINFVGSVMVRGNVTTDFSIKATGNVEVFGVVEGAEIYAGGNIFISRGVQGMDKAKLESGGSITSRSIQNASLEAKGDVYSESIMHSNVVANGRIEVKGKKGVIVGGVVRAFSGMVVKNLGSPMGTATEVHIGGGRNYSQEYEEKRRELAMLQNHYKDAVEHLTELVKKKDVPQDKAMRSSSLNTINNLKIIKEKLGTVRMELEDLAKIMENQKTNSVLEVEDTLNSGVYVRIGNAHKTFTYEEFKCRIRNDKGEIKVSNM
ncbi:MAG: FapA family protein [Defluviitaleaceae bacterium]|nr:FapA family protein [Defluviitaleaceae bacterium]